MAKFNIGDIVYFKYDPKRAKSYDWSGIALTVDAFMGGLIMVIPDHWPVGWPHLNIKSLLGATEDELTTVYGESFQFPLWNSNVSTSGLGGSPYPQGGHTLSSAPKPQQTGTIYSVKLKHDDSLTQPLRNDGERCIYCNRKTVDLVLATSVTKWCPPCETNGTLVNKVVDKRTQPALSSSELDFDEWLAEASKILKIP